MRFISLNDVSLRLRDKLAFEGLSWEMQSDEHWAVLGPNGSGKSVLIRALCGQLPVVKGNITYHFPHEGTPHHHIAHVTFEAQRSVLGAEAYYQARWNMGVEGEAVLVSDYLLDTDPLASSGLWQEVVQQLELGALLKKNVLQLSNGERRKVLIARVLLKRPWLLILDQPLAGLDEQFRARFQATLDSLMQGERRVMIVGTPRQELPRGITHILCVQDSHVIAQGPKPTILQYDAEQSPRFADRLSHLAEYRERSDAPALICLKNVNVSYNGTPVLRQVNWTVRENEQWALLGPNGAGKTTLLGLILGDNPQAYANDITLFGRRRGSGESIWDIKQRIGWVSPELHLYYPRGATCLEVVCSGWFDSVGLYRRPSPQQRESALAWLRRLGLAECAETAIDQFSEGEQRLTLMARALVKSPALLVLDEPCQGLDARNRDRVLQAMAAVSGQMNTSLIYVTHRADELPHNITHVLRLNEGQVVSQMKTRTAYG